MKRFYKTMAFRVQCATLVALKLKQHGKYKIIPVEPSLKRINPLSPLTSSQEEEKKKGSRIPFEIVPIRPKPPSLVVSDTNREVSVKISREQST